MKNYNKASSKFNLNNLSWVLLFFVASCVGQQNEKKAGVEKYENEITSEPSVFSSVQVAILDFENTSGIVKYDGFGKAMSNMLITDLKNSIHPRKVTFLERSQLNKILEELRKLQ